MGVVPDGAIPAGVGLAGTDSDGVGGIENVDAIKDLGGVTVWIGPSGAVEADDFAVCASSPDVCGVRARDAEKGPVGGEAAGLGAPVGAIPEADSAACADDPDAIASAAPNGLEVDGYWGIAIEIVPSRATIGGSKGSTSVTDCNDGIGVGCPDAIEIIISPVRSRLSGPGGAVPFDDFGGSTDGPDVAGVEACNSRKI